MPSRPTRLLLATVLTALLIILTACSGPRLPAAPQALEAVAGPVYAQLYWTHPSPDTGFTVQVSRDGGAWQEPAGLVPGQDGLSALVPLEAGVTSRFRVGTRSGELTVWAEAPGEFSRGQGITLQIGTFNRGDWSDTAGTAFLIYLDGLPVTEPLELLLSGPAGWAAGDHPITVSAEELERGWLIGLLYGLDALDGTYTLRSADGLLRTELRFSHHDFRLAPATDLAVAGLDAAAGQLSASWSPPVADAFTQTAVLSATDHYTVTFAASAEFSGLELDPHDLRLEVISTNATFTGPVMPHPFGAAQAVLDLSLPADE